MKQRSVYIAYFWLSIFMGMINSCEMTDPPVINNPGQGNPGSDGNSGWQPLFLNLNDDLHDLHFINEQSGWVVGQNQTLLATAAGDVGWSRAPVLFPLENLTGVFFVNDQVGWVTGDISGNQIMGQVGFSGNGGGYPVQLEVFDKPLNSLFFLDGNSGWVAGDEGLLAMTVDGGNKWEIIPPFTAETIYDMGFTPAKSGWIVTGNSGIFHTKDGISWSIEKVDRVIDIFSVFIQDEDNVWACGNYNTILHRHAGPDGEAVWDYKNIEEASPNMIWNDIFFSDPSNGWMVGNFGLIYRTTDGGDHWFKEVSNSFAHLNAIHMVTNKRGWAVGKNGTILSYIGE
jgi:photosystem II stability/assembly factor-like uncharacterized protein